MEIEMDSNAVVLCLRIWCLHGSCSVMQLSVINTRPDSL